MSRLAEQFGDVVRGLLSLEINTIVKDGMEAARMPAPAEACERIAAEYAAWLRTHDPTKKEADPLGENRVSAATFEKLKASAERVLTGTAPAPGVVAMASRIRANAAQLATLCAAHGDITDASSLKAEELVRLRKIWEIGTEEVVLQTVIWIDGDVTQRLRPDYATADRAAIRDLHASGVETSLSAWKTLTEILGAICENLWKLLK